MSMWYASSLFSKTTVQPQVHEPVYDFVQHSLSAVAFRVLCTVSLSSYARLAGASLGLNGLSTIEGDLRCSSPLIVIRLFRRRRNQEVSFHQIPTAAVLATISALFFGIPLLCHHFPVSFARCPQWFCVGDIPLFSNRWWRLSFRWRLPVRWYTRCRTSRNICDSPFRSLQLSQGLNNGEAQPAPVSSVCHKQPFQRRGQQEQ